MPDEYKWILQKLMTDRDIGIVISDKTLCLGIDLPILTTCIMGYNDSTHFSNDDFLQMSGRAGRRGLDVKGNTIFYNVDYKSILNSENPSIRGNQKCIKNRYKCCTKDVSNIFKNYIHRGKLIDEKEYLKTDFSQIQWLCRNEDTIDVLLKDLHIINRNIFLKELNEPHIHILNLITKDEDFIISYKNNNLKNILILKELNIMMIKIYNYLKDKRYSYVKMIIKEIFEKSKRLILNHYKLH